MDVEDCMSQTMWPHNNLSFFFLSLSSYLNQSWAWHPVRQHPSRHCLPACLTSQEGKQEELDRHFQLCPDTYHENTSLHFAWEIWQGVVMRRSTRAPSKKMERAVWQVVVGKQTIRCFHAVLKNHHRQPFSWLRRDADKLNTDYRK